MRDDRFAHLPQPPYYSVIFSSRRRAMAADDGYAVAAARMAELAQQQVGFLGMESTRDHEGFGITVAYFDGEAAIKAWRNHVEHLAAQDQGRAQWYSQFQMRVARVERAYGWEHPDA